MKVSVGIVSISHEMLESRYVDCPICGPYETSAFNEAFCPSPCECEEVCANCDISIACDDECEYYEWSFIAALKGQ